MPPKGAFRKILGSVPPLLPPPPKSTGSTLGKIFNIKSPISKLFQQLRSRQNYEGLSIAIGDMLQFKRGIQSSTHPVTIYKHYGIYVGNGEVVHFALDFDCINTRICLKKEKLEGVATKGQFEVDNYLDDERMVCMDRIQKIII